VRAGKDFLSRGFLSGKEGVYEETESRGLATFWARILLECGLRREDCLDFRFVVGLG